MNALQEKITQLLITHFGVAAEAVTPDTTYEQLSLDSLVLIELTMIIKKELGVRLDDDALQAGSTIADTAELIESNGVRV
jgi:acyl carrier protein